MRHNNVNMEYRFLFLAANDIKDAHAHISSIERKYKDIPGSVQKEPLDQDLLSAMHL